MSLSMYYNRAKGGLMNINTKEMVDHGENLMIAGATGAVLGLISASIGGLDHKVAGFEVPVDGLASAGLALAGLSMRSPELLTASIAAGGSAATRTFEGLFKRAIGTHGDFDGGDIPFGFGNAAPQLYGQSMPQQFGWGAESNLQAAAAAL